MYIVFLDTKTFGNGITLSSFDNLGTVKEFDNASQEDLESLVEIKDDLVLVTNKVIIDKQLIQCLKDQLKLICVAATGVNNIDLKTAKSFNIPVCNVQKYSSFSVAFATFAMYFHLNYPCNYYDDYSKNTWAESDLFSCTDKDYNDLSGQIWGIIGLGDIGQKVACIAKSFDSTVVYHSVSGKNINQDYEHQNLETLLKNSDVISIHTALNEKTKDLIKLKELNLLKSTATLINVGRGGIINEQDLLIFLQSNQSVKFALDVLEFEPPKKDNKLLSFKNSNLLLTPHTAWASIKARKKLLSEIHLNITSFLQGKNRNCIL